MTSMNDFQAAAIATAVYPSDKGMEYCTLGLVGEAGEIANKVKKIIRGDYDDNFDSLVDAVTAVHKELGDVLWYAAVLADELGVSLEIVAQDVLRKLEARKKAGTIKGSGDNR